MGSEQKGKGKEAGETLVCRGTGEQKEAQRDLRRLKALLCIIYSKALLLTLYELTLFLLTK